MARDRCPGLAFRGLRACSPAPIGDNDFLVSAASCYRIKGSTENFRTMRNLLAKIHPEGLTGAVIIS